MGAHRGAQVRQYLSASLRLVFIVSPAFVVMGAAIALVAPRMELADDVYRAFRIYGVTLIAGGALTSFWSIIPDSVVKAHQDTRSTMWAGILSNVVNVTLNTLFLFVFHWGVFGIALSTVLGRIAGLVYAHLRARAHERRREASGRDAVGGADPAPYRSILALAVPSSLTFALMAGETALINALLASGRHATEAIAAYSIFHRIVLFALNPIIAASVALLPYSARRFGERNISGVRRGLRQVGIATVAYSVLLVAPVIFAAAPWIARRLAETPVTVEYTIFVLRTVPFACLLGAPFLFLRPVFEGMQRGAPGLVMAGLRYLILTPLLAWIGLEAAEAWNQPGLYGLAIGLLVAAAVTSAVFSLWLHRALQVKAREHGG
jgi:Na+-driven multidrug efflux pump